MNGMATHSARKLNVVVTGGSAGIGAAIVRAFADGGHRVLLTYLTGLKNARKMEDGWPNVSKVHLDQGDVASVAQFSRVVDSWCGAQGVDVLVNNAALGSATVRRYVEGVGGGREGAHENGVAHENGIEEYHENGISNKNGKVEQGVLQDSAMEMMARAANDEALMRVNALGPLWVSNAIMDSIRRAADRPDGRAVVMFIGSVGGGSAAVFPEYCPADLMSKAAMTYLSKHLAAEHAQDNIDVVCISPGATETEMFRQSTLSKVSNVNAFVDSMPKRRLIQPEDVARSVYWLSTQSPQGLFHGAVLDASMGLAVRPGLQTESNGNR